MMARLYGPADGDVGVPPTHRGCPGWEGAAGPDVRRGSRSHWPHWSSAVVGPEGQVEVLDHEQAGEAVQPVDECVIWP